MRKKTMVIGALAALLGSGLAGWVVFIPPMPPLPLPQSAISMTSSIDRPEANKSRAPATEQNESASSARPIEFAAQWSESFRFVSDDPEPDPRVSFDPFDVLGDLPQVEERARLSDPAAAYALFNLVGACEDRLQGRLLAEYSELLAERCTEVKRWTAERRNALLWLASDAAIPTAPMQALGAVERLQPADPRRAPLGLRVIEAMERAAAKDGRLEDVVTLAVAFEHGTVVAQDLRKAVAYYQIAGEASGDTRYAVHAAGLRNQLRGPDIDQVRELQARIFERRQQVLRERAAR